MKKLLAPCILIALTVSACGEENISCSNPAIEQKVGELVKDYFDRKAQATGNMITGMLTQGKYSVQNVVNENKLDNGTLCHADVHIKLDPEATGIKNDVIQNTQYKVQLTDDKKFYITLLSVTPQ